MAVYDKETGRVLNIVKGTFNSAASEFTAECDISEFGDVYAKVFLWNEMNPVTIPGEIR